MNAGHLNIFINGLSIIVSDCHITVEFNVIVVIVIKYESVLHCVCVCMHVLKGVYRLSVNSIKPYI